MLRKKRIKKNLKKIYSKKSKSIWDLAIPIKFNYTSNKDPFMRMFEESFIFGETYSTIEGIIKEYSSCLTKEELEDLKKLGYE